MKQLSFAQAEFAAKKKVTRRERFLAEMEQLVPWAAVIAALTPHYYPQAGKGRGRRPIGLERMLRMYCLQLWYTLADEALEDALYDSQALRTFVGIDLGREAVPDATTLLKFRHLLEALKDKPVTWHIARKRGKIKAMAEGPLKELTRQAERLKARLRARVEHPFHVIKTPFGHRKVRYKGLAKNTAQLHSLFALANLVIAKKTLLSPRSQGAS